MLKRITAMNDRQRTTLALSVSVVFHIILFAFILWTAHYSRGPVFLAESPGEFEINLEQSPQMPTYQLVDTIAPATVPVAQTDLIAEKDSNASSPAPGEGNPNAPNTDTVSDHAAIGAAAVPSTPQAASAPQTPAATEPEKKSEENAEEKNEVVVEKVETPDEKAMQLAKLEPSKKPLARDPAEEIADTQLAQASAQAAVAAQQVVPQPLPSKQTTGKEDGGAKAGFLNFEAMRSEFAPYLRDVQNRVEKRWRTGLELKYRGTQPTNAVVDCAIGPDGKIAYVRIIEPGKSVSYAYVCKEAIEKAGPFPPFPFKVPDMYRDKNLEIRWTFRFM
jgi:hypothetical protein